MPASDLSLQGLVFFREGMEEDTRPQQIFDLCSGPLGGYGALQPGHPSAKISLVGVKSIPAGTGSCITLFLCHSENSVCFRDGNTRPLSNVVQRNRYQPWLEAVKVQTHQPLGKAAAPKQGMPIPQCGSCSGHQKRSPKQMH